eukprot:scaffold2043_cov375-Prasinococcus_capsulatus_cf.AAC.2
MSAALMWTVTLYSVDATTYAAHYHAATCTCIDSWGRRLRLPCHASIGLGGALPAVDLGWGHLGLDGGGAPVAARSTPARGGARGRACVCADGLRRADPRGRVPPHGPVRVFARGRSRPSATLQAPRWARLCRTGERVPVRRGGQRCEESCPL